MLTEDAFGRARDFIERHARPLDVARFRFHFEGGSRHEVWRYLKYFQNSDGGFGRALEPDIRAPESSALATSIAFRIVREIANGTDAETAGRDAQLSGLGVQHGEADSQSTDVPATTDSPLEPMIGDALDYLLATFDENIGGWRIVPASIERSPHAPWWRQTGREEIFNRFSLNPNAELLGYLLDHRQLLPAHVLEAVSDNVMQSMTAADRSDEPLEMHELLCCKSMAISDGLDAGMREDMIAMLQRQVGRVVGGPDDWTGYTLRPLQVAESPQSPFYAALQHLIPDNLDYEIANQQPDGSWAPTWSWGDDHDYPRVWEAAKFEWAGLLTVDTLVVLKRYGKIG